MPKFPQIQHPTLAQRPVDGPDLQELRRLLYIDGRVARPEADFLVALHKRVQRPTPAFEHFFYQAIKDHVLADRRIDADEAAWLRQLVFADGKIDDEERRLLHELKGEAVEVSPEFKALFHDSMKQPKEQHTCG